MTGPFAWILQVAAVTRFGLMSIPRRLGAVAATIVGIAGVVGVLVGVLSIAEGFKAAMKASGSDDKAVVLRSGADSEMVSGLDHETTQIIADAPGVARGSNGPLSSAELYVMLDLPKRSTGTDANVPLRGVDPTALDVRGNIKILDGRMNAWGKNELIAGVEAAQEFGGVEVGHTLKVGRSDWLVTGIFSAGGGTAESELWSDGKLLQAAFDRGDSYQSVYVKLNSAGAYHEFTNSLSSDPRVNVKLARESEYFSAHSETLTTLINTLGFLIAFLMAIGAVFGALNTMYGAVSARSREIATLRALGFGGSAIVVSLMLEALVLALIGGSIGGGLAYLAFNNFHTSTMNWQSFSQVAFAFRVTPALLTQGVIWAAAIGLIGGFFPALRAARLPIATALREL
jgi:putative ABC transport system permease protein